MRHLRVLLPAWLVVVLAVFVAAQAVEMEQKPPQKWALLVGVNDYAHLRDLRYAGKDMQALASCLISHGFAEDHVVLLHDDARAGNLRPTKANIERQLSGLLNSIQENDALFVGFSGHGMYVAGKTFLCPYEAREDNPARTMIAADDIVRQLKHCPAQFRLFLADACRHTRGLATAANPIPPSSMTSAAGNAGTTAGGLAILWSCGPGQTSYEEDRFQHSVFMQQVLTGLRGYADSNRDGGVSVDELHRFAGQRTRDHVALTWKDDQWPEHLGGGAETLLLTRAAARPAARLSEARLTPFWPEPLKTVDLQQPKTVFNSIGMYFKLIPPGEFVMGSPVTESQRAKDEPWHAVRITKPFYLGICEVTQAEYKAVMGTNPSFFSPAGRGRAQVDGIDTDRLPVDSVSWDDAEEFCRRLSAREGRTYRLPTEAEWEYACRAGTRTAFYTGNAEADLAKAGWYGANLTPRGNSSRRTNPVGQKTANGFGLHDMHGNVWEWCADWYGENYYLSSAASDPQGPPSGTTRVIRGGGWYRGPRLCRAAYRGRLSAEERYDYSGFRVCVPLSSAR